jgi:hypothetical protein
MSELLQLHTSNRDTKRWLLASASSLVLMGAILQSAYAADAENDRPTVWIEVGSQLERVSSGEEKFAPPFILAPQPAIQTISPLSLQRPAKYSIGGAATLLFKPQGSDWNFSAGMRYGRSNAAKHVHQQSYPVGYVLYLGGLYINRQEPRAAQFVDTKTRYSEGHAIIDFEVGRDVGLGLFGHGNSTLNAGIRFAQFTSRSRVSLGENPDWHFSHKYVTFPYYGIYHSKVPKGQPYHSFAGSFDSSRSFSGVGPSLSWKGSSPVLGNETAKVAFDWGVNGALLFGRQKAQIHHQTTARYHSGPAGNFAQMTTFYQNPATPDHTRSRSTIIPNIGGFAGLSFNYAAAKVSFGYRADFFFGAMDGGIDTRKTYDRNFYGPYATISIGLGG